MTEDGWLVLPLAHLGVLLRAQVARVSQAGLHRFSGLVQQRTPQGWRQVDSVTLAGMVGAELEGRGGAANPEFVGQVARSRDTVGFLLLCRPTTSAPRLADPPINRYVASEQSLVYGHPLHPTPKWQGDDLDSWSAYAPELHRTVRLHWLAVPNEQTAQDSVDGRGFDAHAVASGPPHVADVPEGYSALPVHPGQWKLITSGLVAPRVAAAVADGTFVDLGPGGPVTLPTASVRTLYVPSVDLFVKPSLHVRITNCVRKNAWYELRGAVLLTRKLAPIAARYAAELGGGFALMPEPAYRTVDPARWGVEAAEALGVIVRSGVRPHLGPGETPLLAGALASGDGEHGVAALLPGHDPVHWWTRYVRLLVPGVLRLWHEHGVVVEPHLQNVVTVVDPTGLPVRQLIRDMEGVKLLAERHAGYLDSLPPDIAVNLGYQAERAWDRLSYCLFVNHLATLAGAIADAVPGIEPELWQVVRGVVTETAHELGGSPFVDRVLAGAPLPMKTSMLLRWSRQADRQVEYVGMTNPLGATVPAP
ncbi:IucA/IucC family siderophore biosynthesis protein [Micromonospora sp. HUAS LYJ1]|uniref:IucA/IucC family protein n=1 Tax=Micromonospora sp. HUAS LYJ1 TaxID=3061626 RepID=UPI0026736E9C|nr:IucA/IucC family protein [Micromonospora sp. HUAS LYJ1]WKU07131.1 IucA/IucC family protein [Micromonospora sp. HUAS LYJ1]